MKARTVGLSAMLAACAPVALSAQDAPPPPLPVLEVSTMLFVMLIGNPAYDNTLDPIEVNDFDIVFDDDNAGTEALDDLLAGK
jgi:hypothetical protein